MKIVILAAVATCLVACGNEIDSGSVTEEKGRSSCTGTLEEVERCEKTNAATKPTEFVPIDHARGW